MAAGEARFPCYSLYGCRDRGVRDVRDLSDLRDVRDLSDLRDVRDLLDLRDVRDLVILRPGRGRGLAFCVPDRVGALDLASRKVLRPRILRPGKAQTPLGRLRRPRRGGGLPACGQNSTTVAPVQQNSTTVAPAGQNGMTVAPAGQNGTTVAPVGQNGTAVAPVG